MLLRTEEAIRVLELLKDSEPRLKVLQRDAIETALEALGNLPDDSKEKPLVTRAEHREGMHSHLLKFADKNYKYGVDIL